MKKILLLLTLAGMVGCRHKAKYFSRIEGDGWTFYNGPILIIDSGTIQSKVHAGMDTMEKYGGGTVYFPKNWSDTVIYGTDKPKFIITGRSEYTDSVTPFGGKEISIYDSVGPKGSNFIIIPLPPIKEIKTNIYGYGYYSSDGLLPCSTHTQYIREGVMELPVPIVATETYIIDSLDRQPSFSIFDICKFKYIYQFKNWVQYQKWYNIRKTKNYKIILERP